MNILKNKIRPPIGQKIFELRNKNNLTQEDLCKLLKVKRRTITYYELEAKRIPLDFAQKLAKIFKVAPSTFLNEKIEVQTHIRNTKLPKRLQRFIELPKEDQRSVVKMIHALADRKNRK